MVARVFPSMFGWFEFLTVHLECVRVGECVGGGRGR